MNPGELQAIESQRQALLGQLTTAETVLRAGLHNTRGFGHIAQAHMERAKAHICEAYIAINEAGHARTLEQLVDDLTRVQQVMDDVKRRKSQRI